MEKEPKYSWRGGKTKIEGNESVKGHNRQIEVYSDYLFARYEGSGFMSTADELNISYSNIMSVSSGGYQTITLRTVGRTIRISGLGTSRKKDEVIEYIRSNM